MNMKWDNNNAEDMYDDNYVLSIIISTWHMILSKDSFLSNNTL